MRYGTNFFSVVIPLYNKEASIACTLRSVFKQYFQDFDVIVLNDGSTDASLDIVNSFTDERLKVYSTENKGVSFARNIGVSKAIGKYIAFLDADDEWRPDYLSEMKALIERYPGNGLYIAAYETIENNHTPERCWDLPEGIVDDYFKWELRHHITRCSASVVCRQAFTQMGGFPQGMVSGEDSFFTAKLATFYPVVYTPKVLALYNKLHSGFCFRYSIADSCVESWLELYREGCYYRNELIASKAIRAAKRYALYGNKLKSRELEKRTRYTKLYKKNWLFLFLVNRIPQQGLDWYKGLRPVFWRLKSFFARNGHGKSSAAPLRARVMNLVNVVHS